MDTARPTAKQRKLKKGADNGPLFIHGTNKGLNLIIQLLRSFLPPEKPGPESDLHER
ncbi:hypothetical protein UUU_06280 [Klebsiella pneumoniae subsp. pneumoniae DSM 30104 = JCM 1662 = NBRC 14940]|nr:hypothetical protein UUU_06280 [Klebsiella pneumoniae subsp. pneumoniae DSM 30104 = JCM 1662 = NBRC 14940]